MTSVPPAQVDGSYVHGPLSRYAKFRVAHAAGMPGTFYPPLRVSDPDMHRGTCVTHVPWCLLGSLTSGFLWSRPRGKCSRHPRRMRNPQCCVPGKRPIANTVGASYLYSESMCMIVVAEFLNWEQQPHKLITSTLWKPHESFYIWYMCGAHQR